MNCRTDLVQVDGWLPEVVTLLVEVSHTDLSEVTWMVFIHVGSVVVLTTSETTTTGMLAAMRLLANALRFNHSNPVGLLQFQQPV